LDSVIQEIVNGLVLGSTFTIVALGFSLVFGVLGVLNVAQADFYTLGAYVSLWVGTDLRLGQPAGILSALVVGAGVGVLLYFLVVRKIGPGQTWAVFIATLGVSYFIENVLARTVGPNTVPTPPLFRATYFSIGGIEISDAQILLVVATVAIGIGLMVWIGRSSLGRDMRAVAENAELARAFGVRVTLVFAVTIGLASALAAVGGVLSTNVTETASPYLASDVAIEMFVITMIAGRGSVGGAMVAGLGLGIVESFTVAYIGSGWQEAVGFAALTLVVLLRPQGLFSQSLRVS
jgi:branched-chain amino acid transport system permease protein